MADKEARNDTYMNVKYLLSGLSVLLGIISILSAMILREFFSKACPMMFRLFLKGGSWDPAVDCSLDFNLVYLVGISMILFGLYGILKEKSAK